MAAYNRHEIFSALVDLLHPQFQLLLYIHPHIFPFLARHQYVSDVVLRSLNRNHLHQRPEPHNHIRAEVAPAGNIDQRVQIHPFDKGVGLQHSPDEDGSAADVLVVLGQQQGLDVVGYLPVSTLPEVVFVHLRPSDKEVEGKNLGEVLGWDLSVVVLAQFAQTNLTGLSEPEYLQQFNHLVEILGSLLVEGADCVDNLLLGVCLEDGLAVSLGDLLKDVLLNCIFAVSAERSEEQIVGTTSLPLDPSRLLLLLLRDLVVYHFDELALGDEFNRDVGHLGVLILHVPHHAQGHGGVGLHWLLNNLDLHLLRCLVGKLGSLEPQLFVSLLGGFGCVGVGLHAQHAVQQVLVLGLVLLEEVLDCLYVGVDFEGFVSDLLSLLDPHDSDEDQSSEVVLKHVVGVDGPETGVLVDGSIQSEEEVGNDLEVVADSVQFAQSVLGVLED